jgi:RNA polymerase sigma-70 factor (ECF subfamily)
MDLESHRAALLRFAMLQLRDRARAEDAVQETMVAALQGKAGFAGQSSARTWLVGILKHKIVDQLRRAARERPLEAGEDALDDVDALFREDGHFENPPIDWNDPEGALGRREFFEVLERCLQGLPPATARVFLLREVMGLETAEICRELSISASNCWVMLYRARMGLRECLERRWFAAESGR